MDSEAPKIILPGGFWCDGECHREVELCPLTGYDEEYFLQSKYSSSQAEWSTAILTRCIKRVGTTPSITPDLVWSLTIGDREALLLHIRKLTLGDTLDCIVHCAQDGCDETMSLELSVTNLLLPPYQNHKDVYEEEINGADHKYLITFRLPTGLDQAQAANNAKSDPSAAAEQLVRSCILKIINDKGKKIDEIPRTVKDQLPGRMADLDPQAELSINITCTGCKTPFNVILDTGTYFLKELKNRCYNLQSEIHLLAYYYHWSEAEIMSMSKGKRQRYCDFLLNSLS